MNLKITDKISTEAKKDIIDLKEKIQAFRKGEIPEEKFASYRLMQGVYGQRQKVPTNGYGVQMVRIKLPFGRVTTDQLIRIADVAEEFTNGNLHTTTRQDIQLHFIRLDDSPALWAQLEEVGVTTREACGNTVRNITASSEAGIDTEEPFDVSPYAYEAFEYFLRSPIIQDMGRKIKIAFSSSEKDSALTFIHDIGFIPRVKFEKGKEKRGFKVVVGGGLGAQTFIAQTAYEFLEEDQIIPFIEGTLRVFDRYGERAKRFKARMKFLVDEKTGMGLKAFLDLVKKERKALSTKLYIVNRNILPVPEPAPEKEALIVEVKDEVKYQDWLKTNVFEQKQLGFYGIQLKLQLGNIHAEKARKLAALVKEYAADDIRITVNQGLLLKFVRSEALPNVFTALDKLGLAEPGFDTIVDITACPGTDTCNLGVTNSTALAKELESVLKKEYYDLIFDSKILIKISGCMNSCGQHMAANIGLHGSSIKNGAYIAPAMQIVLGGGIDPSGKGLIGDKIIKIPTKKVPDALKSILNDYEDKTVDGEYFNDYYRRLGKDHFYQLLKPFADKDTFKDSDYVDWTHKQKFKPEVGVGECAGVSYDVIASIIEDSQQRLESAKESLADDAYADSLYHSYSAFVIGAKSLLLSKDVRCNTQIGIIKDFDEHFVVQGDIILESDFKTLVLDIKNNEPNKSYAQIYLSKAKDFLSKVKLIRKAQIEYNEREEDKVVVDSYYTA